MLNVLRVLSFALLILVGVPSVAQAREQSTEQVLVDMQVWLIPPGGDGYCARLDSGTLTVDLQLVGQDTILPARGQGQPWPINFKFYGYRGFDNPASIDTTISSLDPSTVTRQLQGGDLYCFGLQNLAQVPPNAPMAELTKYWQGVNFRMTLQSGRSIRMGAWRKEEVQYGRVR